MSADILTIAASGFPGPNRTLESLERCTGLTRHLQLHSNDPDGPELAFYAGLIREQQPQLVLFGGWCPLYERLLSSIRRAPTRFAVWWLSTAGQTDMSSEVDRLGALLHHPRIRYFAFAQKSLAASLRHHVRNVTHLPIPMDLAEFTLRQPREDGPVRLSLFCSPHEYRRKNILNTLLAVANLQQDYRLYLNGLSREMSYRRLLRTLSIRYTECGWLSDEAYRSTLDTIDIGLQLSFTESFNQVSAEHLARGIPVLASPFVPAMDAVRGADRSRLIVDPEDSPAIGARLDWLTRHPRARRDIGLRASTSLRTMIIQNNRLARRILKQWREDA